MGFSFYFEFRDFSFLERNRHRNWLRLIINNYGFIPGRIAYIFETRSRMLELNKRFLNHHYHTDVITFDYSRAKALSGDIFIGVEQVVANAENFSSVFEEELRRVMIHAVFHLMGYDDASDDEKQIMRSLETEALSLWDNV